MKYLIKLIYISIIDALIIKNIKILYWLFLAILHIKKIKTVINAIELESAQHRVALIKTIILNFNSLPRQIAWKFPIHVYTNTKIISTSGTIDIIDAIPYFGMIKWGWNHSFRSQGKTKIQNRGKIIFGGEEKIIAGSEIVVFPNAELKIGSNCFIGENVLIYCTNAIELGTCVTISYQSDISDSDFHYCLDIHSGLVCPKNKSVTIGDYNWIGNRTTIKKGTQTPHHVIVASAGAVLSKNYINTAEPFSILGGCPAKVIKTGMSRIWHNEREMMKIIDQQMNPETCYRIPENKISTLIKL